jgi:HK97 family phage prohead protease
MAITKLHRTVVGAAKADDNSRVIKYKFSDGSVARDNHTISNSGWDLTNFKSNPVFLWAHDASQLPIGKVTDIAVTSAGLMGSVEYLTADQYPFADTVYQLVRSGYLNATSVSWNPLDWKYSTDKSRPGGIDFLKQELLEVSQVPVPALPGALVEARKHGIDTGPIYQWAERILDSRGIKSRKACLQLETLRSAAKMPKVERTAFTPKQTESDRRIEVMAMKAKFERTCREHDAKMLELYQTSVAKRQSYIETSTLEGRIAHAKRMKKIYSMH